MEMIQGASTMLMENHQEHMLSLVQGIGSIPLVGDSMQQAMIFIMKHIMRPTMEMIAAVVGFELPPCPL